jgi:hypothetical protein
MFEFSIFLGKKKEKTFDTHHYRMYKHRFLPGPTEPATILVVKIP